MELELKWYYVVLAWVEYVRCVGIYNQIAYQLDSSNSIKADTLEEATCKSSQMYYISFP